MALVMCWKCENRGKMCEFLAEETDEALLNVIYLANRANSYSRQKKTDPKPIKFKCNLICENFKEKRKDDAE